MDDNKTIEISNQSSISLLNIFSMIENKFTSSINKLSQSISSAIEQNKLTDLTTYKYIDIDSTYRNRTIYPLASNFVVSYTNASPGTDVFTAKDPVTTAYPYETGTVGATPSTTTKIYLTAATASTIENYYVNSYIEINNEFKQISSYILTPSPYVTVTSAFSIIPVAGSVYKMRNSLPVTTGTLQAGSTSSYVVLAASSSSQNDYYKGMFIAFNSGPNSGLILYIVKYDGTTKHAFLNKSLNTLPGLDNYEIDQFSYDNARSLQYSGSLTMEQPACYVIQLLQLTVPSALLNVGDGGHISLYPFLYVHFYNDNNKYSDITMYGNNPAATRATFKIAVDRSAVVTATNAKFVAFNSIIQSAPQTIKLSLLDPIRFRVTLPNGEDLAYTTPDTPSPQIPIWYLQISALVAVTRYE